MVKTSLTPTVLAGAYFKTKFDMPSHIPFAVTHSYTKGEHDKKNLGNTALRHSFCIFYLRTQQNITRNFIYCFQSKDIIRKYKKQSTSHTRRSAIPVPKFRALYEALWIFDKISNNEKHICNNDKIIYARIIGKIPNVDISSKFDTLT